MQDELFAVKVDDKGAAFIRKSYKPVKAALALKLVYMLGVTVHSYFDIKKLLFYRQNPQITKAVIITILILSDVILYSVIVLLSYSYIKKMRDGFLYQDSAVFNQGYEKLYQSIVLILVTIIFESFIFFYSWY